MNQDRPKDKDWRELCKAAANEPDPDKLMDLIVELNRALDEREKKRKTPEDANCAAGSLRSVRGVT